MRFILHSGCLPDPPRRCVRGGPPRPGYGQPTGATGATGQSKSSAGKVHGYIGSCGLFAGLGCAALHTALYPSITCCDLGRPAGLTVGKKAPSHGSFLKRSRLPSSHPPRPPLPLFSSLKPPFPREPEIRSSPTCSKSSNNQSTQVLLQHQTTLSTPAPTGSKTFPLSLLRDLQIQQYQLSSSPPPVTTTNVDDHHQYPPPHYVNPTAATVAAASTKRKVQSPSTNLIWLACWAWLIQRRAITCNGHSPQ